MTQEELEAEFNVGYLTAFSVLVQDGVDVPQGVPQDVPQGKKMIPKMILEIPKSALRMILKKKILMIGSNLIYAKIPR